MPLFAVSPLSPTGLSAWVARRIGLREVCVEELGFIEFTDVNPETPVQRTVDFIGQSHVSDFAQRLASRSSSPDFVARVLEVSVLRDAQSRFHDLFQVLVASRILGLDSALVVSVDPWVRRILRGSDLNVSVVRTPSFRAFGKAVRMLRRALTQRRLRDSRVFLVQSR